jgi:hypothetical protein
MTVSTSVVSRYAKRLLPARPASGSFWRGNRRSRRNTHRFHCVAAEVLEELTLLSPTVLFPTGSCVGIGRDLDRVKSVATDRSGNIYVTGFFSGTVNFDPSGNTSLTAAGNTGIFVAKYTSSDSLVWVRQMGGNATSSSALTDSGNNIALDASGNVYVVGRFMDSSATFGSTILHATAGAGGWNAFVEKLDANGTVQWAQTYGISDESAEGVGVDSSGNVYALGANWNNGNRNCDIFKFSPSGSAVWSESIYTQAFDSLDGFAVDRSGDVFVAANFTGTVNFSPTGKTHYVTSPEVNVNSGFVLKLNTNGRFQWVSAFIGQTVGSSIGSATLQSLALDNSGDVVVGGSYGGTISFNGGPLVLPPAGGGLLAKLDGSGALVWAEGLVGSSSLSSLAVDSLNNIYGIAGASVMEFDASGNVVHVDTFSGTGSTSCAAISVETNGTIVVVGGYEGTINFDPNGNNGDGTMTSSSTTSDDLFILQLNQL